VIASAKAGLKAYNTIGLELHNVQVNAESGPAFLLRDSKEAELDHISSRKPLADVPVVRIDRSPGTIVRDSRAFAGNRNVSVDRAWRIERSRVGRQCSRAARRPTQELKLDFWKEAEPPTEGETRTSR